MKKLLFTFILLSFVGCKTKDLSKRVYTSPKKVHKERKAIEPDNTVFYFIRHAEINDDGTDDPNLSELGKKKVKKFITYFKDKRLDSVFTTNFNRTTQTAVPIARSKEISGDFYNPNDVVVKQWLKRNRGKAILIVGHSNTTPYLVNKFIGTLKYSQMMDDNYSDIYRVIFSNGETYDDLLDIDEEIIILKNLQISKNKRK